MAGTMKLPDLKRGIDERFLKVDERLQQIDERFLKVDERFQQIDERFQKVDERFQKVDERFDAIEQRIAAEGEKTRRHFDVVAEKMHADIEQIAQGNLEAHRRLNVHDSEITTTASVLDEHELRITALERDRR